MPQKSGDSSVAIDAVVDDTVHHTMWRPSHSAPALSATTSRATPRNTTARTKHGAADHEAKFNSAQLVGMIVGIRGYTRNRNSDQKLFGNSVAVRLTV